MPAFSLDGRHVVFVSQANDLTTNDNLRPYLDVFVRDLLDNQTALVSVNSSGAGGGNGNSNLPTISSSGQWIAFESTATNLVAATDTNRVNDVFVRDTVAGTTLLVSARLGWNGAGNRSSFNPAITPNGRWIVFESAASDLVFYDLNGLSDVFVRDLQAGTTRLVSAIPTNKSVMPHLTPDGRFVSFVSALTNAGADILGQVYVLDLQSNILTDASARLTNFFQPPQLPARVLNPVLSDDGRFVAFKAGPRDSSSPGSLLLRYDLQNDTLVQVASNTVPATPPEMSVDGRYIAYEGFGTNQASPDYRRTNVYVWDGLTSSNSLASVDLEHTGTASHNAHTPVMTPDGTKLVFLSAATNLVAGVDNGKSQVFIRDLAQGITRLVSISLSRWPSVRDIDVTLPAISPDGRLVAFESSADDLVGSDNNQASDVFVRDMQTNTIRLISQRDGSLAGETGAAATSVLPNSVSADGRVVAFASRDSNLVAGDTNRSPDKYVRDHTTRSNHLLSSTGAIADIRGQFVRQIAVSAGGRYVAFVQPENIPFQPIPRVLRYDLQTGSYARASLSSTGLALAGEAPTISSDGRLVAFQSWASTSEFVEGIPQGAGSVNVFLRDIQAGTNQVISMNHTNARAANGNSTEPMLSPDSRWVLFASTASDLVPPPDAPGGTGGNPSFRSLFVRDLATGTNRLISIRPGGPQIVYGTGAVFSADSRVVAWTSASNEVIAVNLFAGPRTLVCSNCQNPSLNGDGRLVAYETVPNEEAPFRQARVKDLQTGQINLVSISHTGTSGNGHTTAPQVSGDGRFVVFASKASNLVENDANGVSDIFVRDRLLGTTMLISVNAQGRPANSISSHPIMAADGRTVVFQSFASDLVAGDYNDHRDIFVLRLGAPDTDGDGLDDDWEMTYFSDLTRDGAGDFDSDGQTDRDEFLAGTNPTNYTSLLRVMTLTSSSGGNKTILWSAVAGRTYRAQFKNRVDDPQWTDLPTDVTATSSTAAVLDTTASGQTERFYRVVRLP